jgi:hypothetical protein
MSEIEAYECGISVIVNSHVVIGQTARFAARTAASCFLGRNTIYTGKYRSLDFAA